MRKLLFAIALLVGCGAQETPVEFHQHAAAVGPSSAERARMQTWLRDYLHDEDVVNGFTTEAGDEVACIPVRKQWSLRDKPGEQIDSPPPNPAWLPLNSGMNTQGFGAGYDLGGRRRWCDPGHIPVRRYTMTDLENAGTLKNFFGHHALPPGLGINTHKYAAVKLLLANWGGQALTSIWKPASISGEGSIMQMWYTAGSYPNVQSVEEGWDVQPGKGWNNPTFFVSWTRDFYISTGCYNLECSGFVQTDINVCLGCSYSSWGNPNTQTLVREYHQVQKIDGGNWWVAKINWIGYYPRTLYLSPGMYDVASNMAAGGEVQTLSSGNVVTDMGDGQYGSSISYGGFPARMDNVQYRYDPNNNELAFNWNWPPSVFEWAITNANCYDMGLGGSGTLFTGGLGKGAIGCP